MDMEKPLQELEKSKKLRESFSQKQLYIIADALMRAYHLNPSRQDGEEIKILLHSIADACPAAKHYVDSVKEKNSLPPRY